MRIIRQTSIKTQLFISFALIIGIFGSVTLYSNHAIREAERLHQHHRDSILFRRHTVLELHQEFTYFRLILRRSFLSTAWYETANPYHWDRYEQLLTDSYEKMLGFVDAHLESIYADDYVTREFALQVISTMDETQRYINRIYAIFHDRYFLEGDGSRNKGNALEYMDNVVTNLHLLRELADQSVDRILPEIDQIVSRNELLTSIVIFPTLLIGVLMAWFILRTFTNRIRNIESNVRQIRRGDFAAYNAQDDDNEISRIVADMVSIFSDLVSEINRIAHEVKKDNLNEKIHTNRFDGVYLEAATAVNTLVKNMNHSRKKERESAELMEKMFNAVPLLIEYWDKDNQCAYCNQTALDFYQFNSSDEYAAHMLEMESIYQVDGTTSREYWISHIQKIFETGDTTPFEYVCLRPGDREEVHFNVYPKKMEFKGEEVVVTYCHDISVNKEIEMERQRVELATENSQAKSRFLARMSHEIRTPLSAVLGISEIQLQSPGHSLAVVEAFAKIHNSANILLSLVNDILDLSKIESGKMTLIEDSYDVASMIIDVAQMSVVYMGSKKIEFNVKVDENLPSRLVGDELRIRQVLNNLLSNAFKYTEAGTVELIVNRLESVKKGYMVLQIGVRDDGRGMSDEQMAAVYEEYARFHEKESRLVEGTGLGMSIVHNLLQLMDARIEVQSQVGVGTYFNVYITQAIDSEQVIGAEIAGNLLNMNDLASTIVKNINFQPEHMPYGKVLVVDDNDTNLYVSRGLMSFYGLQIETCNSGKKAINLIGEGQIYDIVFMDHMMPDMDGVEVTKIVREMGYTEPIVALTANALIGQADEFLKNGFDGFLSKPIQTYHLNGVLIKFIRDKQTQATLNEARAQSETNHAGNFISNIDSGNSLNDFMNKEADKLRLEFAREQRNTFADIQFAINSGDLKTAHRLAHTLKSLASFIKEDNLVNIARGIEKKLYDKEIPTEEEMGELETELSKVLEYISKTHTFNQAFNQKMYVNGEMLSKEEQAAIFSRLQTLLAEDNAESLILAEKLEHIPEFKVLVYQIKSCEFEEALVTLESLRKLSGV